MAYRLALLPYLSAVQNVFHVSLLKAYHQDNSHVVNFKEIELQLDLTYPEDVVKIVDNRVKELRNLHGNVKIRWRRDT